MKHGQVSVWAPSKMVLDAVVSPPLHATAVDLAYWLAGELGAAEFVLMSRDELPQGTVPARRDLMEETP